MTTLAHLPPPMSGLLDYALAELAELAGGWAMTEKQLAILRRRGILWRPELTAGEASELIAAELAGGPR